MQTGQYAHNHYVLGNTPPSGGYQVFNDTNDLPIWLQTAGYRTIQIGKMPNGFPAPKDPNYVPPGWGPSPATPTRLEGRVLRLPRPRLHLLRLPAQRERDRQAIRQRRLPDRHLRDIAVDRIDNHAANFPNTPLYMQVQFFAPYDPNQPATRHAGVFSTALLPVDKSFNEKDLRDKPAW